MPVTPRLPSHEEIELTLFAALALTGAAPSAVDPETSIETLALGAAGLATLSRALNDAYALNLAYDELQLDHVRTLADIVLLVRLHLIRQQIAIK